METNICPGWPEMGQAGQLHALVLWLVVLTRLVVIEQEVMGKRMYLDLSCFISLNKIKAKQIWQNANSWQIHMVGIQVFTVLVFCTFLCFLKILKIKNWRRRLALSGYWTLVSSFYFLHPDIFFGRHNMRQMELKPSYLPTSLRIKLSCM